MQDAKEIKMLSLFKAMAKPNELIEEFRGIRNRVKKKMGEKEILEEIRKYREEKSAKKHV